MGTDADRREDARRETIDDRLDRLGVTCEDCGHRWILGGKSCPRCGGGILTDLARPDAVLLRFAEPVFSEHLEEVKDLCTGPDVPEVQEAVHLRGNPEITFSYIGRPVGAHIHVRVFAGPTVQARALNGTLLMAPGEWERFKLTVGLLPGHETREEERR